MKIRIVKKEVMKLTRRYGQYEKTKRIKMFTSHEKTKGRAKLQLHFSTMPYSPQVLFLDSSTNLVGRSIGNLETSLSVDLHGIVRTE